VAWVDVDVEDEVEAQAGVEVLHEHVAYSAQVGDPPPPQGTFTMVTTGLFHPRLSTQPAMLGSLRSK